MAEAFAEFVEEPLKQWLLVHQYPGLAAQAKAIAVILVASVPVLVAALSKGLRQAWRWYRVYKHTKDLHPYFSVLDVEKATRYFVPSQFQSVSPAAEDEPGQTAVAAARQPLIPWLLNEAFAPGKDDQRFYILLGGTGMGKSTLMINLLLSYRRQLRWWRRPYDIGLFPLAHPQALEHVSKIEKKRDTILLLDAFDEDVEACADYRDRMRKIVDAAADFREVLITCRTHFFPSEEEEPNDTGLLRFGGDKGEHRFTKLYLSPFNDADIRRYLRRRYSWRWLRRRAAARTVLLSPNLMARPMLLDHIDDLSGPTEKPLSNGADIYAELIERWILREARQQPGEAARNRFADGLRSLSSALAVELYRRRQHGKALTISRQELEPFATSRNIELSEIDVQSRSLLNRTALGDYKFAHKSVLEFLLARNAFDNPEFARELKFDGIDAAAGFCLDLLFSADEGMCPVLQVADEAKYQVPDGSAPLLTASKFRDLDARGFFRSEMHRHVHQVIRLSGAHSRRPFLETKAMLWRLKTLRALRAICLSDYDEIAADALSEMRNLVWLELVRVRQSVGDAIVHLRELQQLILEATPVDIATLSGLTSLLHLSLRDIAINDLSLIARLPGLTSLELQGISVSSPEPWALPPRLRALRIESELLKSVARHARISPLTAMVVRGPRSGLEEISAFFPAQGFLYLPTDIDDYPFGA